MVTHVHKMIVTPLGKTPSKEDIQEAVDYALHFACIVDLSWRVEYSGNYSIYIDANDNVDDVWFYKIPRLYGL